MSEFIQAKATLKGRDLSVKIDIEEFFLATSEETQDNLLQSLACEEYVIRHVTDQILHGFTENCSSGGTSYPIKSDSTRMCALDEAGRRIAKGASRIAKDEIEKLEKRLEELEGENEALRNVADDLQQKLSGRRH